MENYYNMEKYYKNSLSLSETCSCSDLQCDTQQINVSTQHFQVLAYKVQLFNQRVFSLQRSRSHCSTLKTLTLGMCIYLAINFRIWEENITHQNAETLHHSLKCILFSPLLSQLSSLVTEKARLNQDNSAFAITELSFYQWITRCQVLVVSHSPI